MVKVELVFHFPLVYWFFISCSSGIANGNSSSEEEAEIPNQYKEAIFIYPQGIRSERDIPICQKWMDESGGKQGTQVKDGSANAKPDGIPPDGLTSGGSVTLNEGMRWEWGCNIVHKRYFYPPVIERLCRCTDRTECPWEWSPPPNYPNSLSPNPKGSRDPFTMMLSSRSQIKFCGEVSTILPRCKNVGGGKKSKEENLVKTIRRTGAGEEIPSISVNCYCPPLFRKWTFAEHIESPEYGNGSLDSHFSYRCERLPRCQTDERCGNIRTDLHFSFYSCSCPKNHLCLPRNYPVERMEDVEEDVHEVLFHGQVAPAYCTPYT